MPIPLVLVSACRLRARLEQADATTRTWVTKCGFCAAPGSHCLIAAADGSLAAVWVGVEAGADLGSLAGLAQVLPPGRYALQAGDEPLDAGLAALGFALGAYRFQRYRPAKREAAELELPDGVDGEALAASIAAVALARDLINTPSQHLGPSELAQLCADLAALHGGEFRQWQGEQLLAANFPAIHAVGRASDRAPRLLELNWGNPAHPRLALVGKGVCFDSGGLDLKTAEGMRNMKKDMGGAAVALALAGLILGSRLPVRLQLLIPAVDNAIAGNAYRPGEVITTRNGLSVEIDNTDAEGRVILGDALAYAAEASPDLIIDLATLTGAARIALGPELTPVFSNREDLGQALLAAGRSVQDPVWPMPLWRPYREYLESSIADLANSSASRHAGAITAALYLEHFVPAAIPWLHLDLYAWNDRPKPGRPQGGEAQSLRALFAFLRERYA